MNKEKAKAMLAKLRTRTEARGATPAEAEQAAKTAERIAKRYGLDIDPADGESFYDLKQKRWQWWAHNLAFCMQRRFGIEGFCKTQTGQPFRISFKGPEHLVSVAIWLFQAIEKDLESRSYVAARSQGYRGSELTAFRNQFRESAVAMIYKRLFPDEVERLRIERESEKAEDEPEEHGESFEQWKARMKKMTPTQLKKQMRKDLRNHAARKYGSECGAELELGTNAVGDRSGVTQAIEH